MLCGKHSDLMVNALESDRAVRVQAPVGVLRYVFEQGTLLS